MFPTLGQLPALPVVLYGLVQARRLAVRGGASVGRRLLAASRRRAGQRLRDAAGEVPPGLPPLGTPWPTA